MVTATLAAPRRASAGKARTKQDRLPGWQARIIARYIEENLHRALKVEALAALAAKSPSHFSRAFRGNFGKPPHAYVLERRIAFAKQQLLETGNPICDIALACGLADQAHLSRLFRRQVGMPPGAWRQQQRAHRARKMHDADPCSAAAAASAL